MTEERLSIFLVQVLLLLGLAAFTRGTVFLIGFSAIGVPAVFCPSDQMSVATAAAATGTHPYNRRITRGRRFMRVRFWGTRGSISKAGRETLRYGGN